MNGIQNSNLGLKYQNKTAVNDLAAKPSFAAKNNSSEVSEQPKPKKSPWPWFGLGVFAPLLSPVISLKLLKAVKKDADLGINRKSVDKVLKHMSEENKLAEKGVKFEFLKNGSKKAEVLNKNYGGASYSFSKKQGVNKVSATVEKASLSLHEVGHAINRNCTKMGKGYWNILEKMKLFETKLPKSLRKFFPLSPITVPVYASFILYLIGNAVKIEKPKNKNPENEEKQNKKFSISKFIHDNLGKLTLAAFAPMLIDESTATIRALKATKKASPEILKPLRKNLLLAFGSYLAITATTLVSTLSLRKFSDTQKENLKKN